jgi:hypothetical protein
MKINEYWRTENTQTPTSDHETTDLPLSWTEGGVTKRYTTINTQNDDKWDLKNDGWYYYKTPLGKDETTDSLLASVTFNCEVNTVGEVRYSLDGTSGESIPNDYANANYHVFITFQMSDEPLLSRLRLYDEVARQTLGSDANIDFKELIDGRDPETGYPRLSTEGVFTYSGQASGSKAVHYYRGYGVNNFIKFNNMCWRIVRTTGTGGTKIMYHNTVESDGTCSIKGNSVYNTSMSYSDSGMTNSSSGMVSAGYMTNPDYHFDGWDANGNSDPDQHMENVTFGSAYAYGVRQPVVVSRGIKYENGVYSLTGDTAIFPSDDYYNENNPRYFYSCLETDVNATCEKAALIISSAITNGIGRIYLWPLKNGKLMDDAKREFFSNVRDSSLKAYLDGWYEDNLISETDKFEDTQWCNDRKLTSGPYMLNDDYNHNPEPSTFAAYDRIMNGTPSVDCEREDDQFTVSSENGNGKLKYPMAILTADEIMMAGHIWEEYQDNWRITYLYGYNGEMSMTPALTTKYGYGELPDGVMMYSQRGSDSGNLLYESNLNGHGIRPMVSFKYDTYVAGGSGTAADPYTLEW